MSSTIHHGNLDANLNHMNLSEIALEILGCQMIFDDYAHGRCDREDYLEARDWHAKLSRIRDAKRRAH